MPFSHLHKDIQQILDTLSDDALVPRETLGEELERYVRALYVRAEFEEHFDTRTALATIDVCRSLVKALPPEPSERQHRLTQAAIRYFVLQEDADSDTESMIGFDDDLMVARAVADALGLTGRDDG
ncbi:MAG: hypothetical protein AAFN78_03505 [Pseudomonadota bacterium]